mmetsp:Transcript_18904/g.32636  ORF Transcript_18904/g.32636 Transcript_18904/m.32636 type:complete len:200 (-) Transcript_18904:96-695(-)
MPTIAPIDKPGSDETTTNIGGDCSVVAVGDGLSVVVVLVFGHSVVVVVVFGKVIGIVRCGAFVVVDVVGFVVGSCGVRLLLLDVDVDDEGCVVGGFGVGFGVGFGAGFGRVWNFERVSNVCDDEGAAGAGFGLVLIVLNVCAVVVVGGFVVVDVDLVVVLDVDLVVVVGFFVVVVGGFVVCVFISVGTTNKSKMTIISV